MAYTICNLDKMSGTEDSSLLVSLRYFDSENKEAAIENGSVVQLGDLLDGEGELYKASAPKSGAKVNDLVLVSSPEIIYDQTRHHNLDEYINEAGHNCRGYHFHSGDGFSITKEGFSGTPSKGNYVSVTADSTKFKVSAASPAASDISIGKIIDVRTYKSVVYYYIKVSV